MVTFVPQAWGKEDDVEVRATSGGQNSLWLLVTSCQDILRLGVQIKTQTCVGTRKDWIRNGELQPKSLHTTSDGIFSHLATKVIR